MATNNTNTKNSVCEAVVADKSVKTITIVKVFKIAKKCEMTREMFDEHYEEFSQKKRDFMWAKMVEAGENPYHDHRIVVDEELTELDWDDKEDEEVDDVEEVLDQWCGYITEEAADDADAAIKEEECDECGEKVAIWWNEEGKIHCRECNEACDGCDNDCRVCREDEESDEEEECN